MKKLKADMELMRKADDFLMKTQLFHSFNRFCTNLFLSNVGNFEWLHSDRWSVIYDWLEEQSLEKHEKPDGIVTALTEYFETNYMNIKETE